MTIVGVMCRLTSGSFRNFCAKTLDVKVSQVAEKSLQEHVKTEKDCVEFFQGEFYEDTRRVDFKKKWPLPCYPEGPALS